MKTKVRFGVIGAGGQCTQSLMPAIPFLKEIELVAVCDLQSELAERNARNFGARSVYTDIDEMRMPFQCDSRMHRAKC